MDADPDLVRRIADLESALLFQDRRVETLDRVVREFSGEVERLQAALRKATTRLDALEASGQSEGHEDPNW